MDIKVEESEMPADGDCVQNVEDKGEAEDPEPPLKKLKREIPDVPTESSINELIEITIESVYQKTAVDVHSPNTSNNSGAESVDDFHCTSSKKSNVAKKSTTKGAVEAFKNIRAEQLQIQEGRENKIQRRNDTVSEHRTSTTLGAEQGTTGEGLLSAADELKRLVPTSLFRCPSCKVCFVSADVAAAHKCSHDETYQCHYCKRLIVLANKTEHQKQHKMLIKLQPQKYIQTLYDRIIRECPYCSICFGNNNFNSHFTMCGKISARECEKCSALIPASEYQNHPRDHRDTFKIQYVISTTVPGIRQLSEQKCSSWVKGDKSFETSTVEEDSNNSSDVNNSLLIPATNENKEAQLFKCKTCQVILMTARGKSHHRCIPEKDKRHCSICGGCYMYTKHTFHQDWHKTNRNYTIKDFEPSNPIKPKTCDDKSLDREEPDSTCGTEPSSKATDKVEGIKIAFICVDCRLITDTYDSAVEHSLMHRTKIVKHTKKCTKCEFRVSEDNDEKLCARCRYKLDDFLIFYNPLNTFTQGCNPSLFEWPDSLKGKEEKYFKLFNTFSIYNEVTNVQLSVIKNGDARFTVYKCGVCHVAVDKNNIEQHWESKCADTIRYSCEPCDIPFESKNTFVKHQTHHETNVNFRILQFTGPVFKGAVTKYEVFTCGQCSCSELNESTRDNHTCVRRSDRMTCDLCGLTYDKYWKEYHNENVHLINPGLERENVIHKLFNLNSFEGVKESDNDSDSGSDNNYSPGSSQHVEKLEDRATPRVNNNKPAAIVTVFKCQDCSVVMFTKKSTRAHKCLTDDLQHHCDICDENFGYHKEVHKDMHRKYEDQLKAGQFTCILFKSRKKLSQSSKKEKPVAQVKTSDTVTEKLNNTGIVKKSIVYECACGVHFLSIESATQHADSCNKTVGKPTTKCTDCKHCGLSFPINSEFVNHKSKHHSPGSTEIVIHEYSVWSNVIKNERRESQSSRAESQSRRAESQSRRAESQSRRNEKIDQQETTMDKKASVSVKKGQNPSPKVKSGRIELLFKCVPCNVFFVSQQACEDHTRDHKELDDRYNICCKLCSLQFRILDLEKHVKYNHSQDYDPDCVLVQEFTPRREGSPDRLVTRL